MYKIDLYTTGSFTTGSSRWPWPTFHHDAARTGCSVAPSTTMRSASIVGRITHGTARVQEATVRVEWFNGTSWVTPGVHERLSETRPATVLSAGTGSTGDEMNEGGYVINQLPPNGTYTITATDPYNQQEKIIIGVAVTTGKVTLNIVLTP